VNRPPLVSVLHLNGMIASGGRMPGLNDVGLAPLIERAFRKGKPTAVALLLNSPGGSPVQSSLIAGRIRRLAEEREIPVHAFVEDVAASGGYWLATAADEIWLDRSSVVGSIGVIMAGFGLQEFISRHGIERRVHVAGRSKSLLDPFRPEKAAEVKKLKAVLGQIHEAFIAQVRARRGARLAEGKDLFSGEFWIGEEAVALGLADGIGHLVPKMKERYGDKVRFAHFSRKRPLLARFGARLVEETAGAIEERAAFARFGL